MLKVNILTDRNFVSYFFFFPLLVNRGRLRDIGIDVSFYEDRSCALWDADVVLLDSKVMGWVKPVERLLGILEKEKRPGSAIVWLDSSASSGTTHFEVMPHVDGYWKKQVLKELEAYRVPMAGGRPYTDFYTRNAGVSVENTYEQYPLEPEHEHKLAVSWNLGVGAYGVHNRVSNLFRLIPWRLKQYLPMHYRGRAHAPGAARGVRVAFRGSSRYSNSALSYQRLMCIQKMTARGLPTEPLKHGAYWHELRRARLAISPFGFGEICYRDFEVFLAGATLMKPSMEHLETYPAFFTPDETYLPFQWDFADFDERLDGLLARPQRQVEIAAAGQERYLRFRSRQGQEAFCSRFEQRLAAVTDAGTAR